jgi:8-oxo-dGTP pyrophosphatase MutT (NUDIX family)
MTDPQIRPAATLILLRGVENPAVLMGQRGAGAVFMPSKYVFPGGGIDAADQADPAHLSPECTARLQAFSDGPAPAAIAGAALRELAEETGLTLRAATPMRFMFRAITPPGRSRRFDARFFMVDAGHVLGDPDDFTGAQDELSHLHWVPLPAARALDLPFITEVVLAEVAAIARGLDQPGVPFFDNSGHVPTFRRIG